LVCEKNISVSHIANGATRLQPAVLGIGQAAGMAAALCVEQNCQPRDLSVRSLQEALLQDPIAPAMLVPLFNLPPQHLDWLYWQHYYLEHPEDYPRNGYCPELAEVSHPLKTASAPLQGTEAFVGKFQRRGDQDYSLMLHQPIALIEQTVTLVTLRHEVDHQLRHYESGQELEVQGRLNRSGNWLLAEAVSPLSGL
jgi:hypothetical protein